MHGSAPPGGFRDQVIRGGLGELIGFIRLS
jgi:hypothetical protein